MMAERKSHVVRIKGKQKVEGGDHETLDDVWADIRRTDELPLNDPGDGQERILFIAWDDDFTGDPPEDDDRIERIIKLTDPENPPEDPDDPDIYIPIPVLDQFAVFDADQKIIIQLANKRVEDDGDETLREVRVKRITHADTDPAEMPDPVSTENYSRVIDTVDESQYIDHEVIESSPHFDADQEHRLLYGADDDDLMNSFETPPEDAQNKPIRLDLLQNIVNIAWARKVYIVVCTNAGDFAEPLKDNVKVLGSDSVLTPGASVPVAAVLLECPANSGEDFLRLTTTYASNDFGMEFWFMFVIPHKKEYVESWFDEYVVQFFEGPNNPFENSPWLYFAQNNVPTPQTITFNIKDTQRLIDRPTDGTNNKIVKVWPNGGAGVDFSGTFFVNGYVAPFYSVQLDGLGPAFSPPEWKTFDAWVIELGELGTATQPGLPFGVEPPKVAADV